MELPIDFISRTKKILGEDEYAAFEKALKNASPVSIRINTLKWEATVSENNVPWAVDGLYLKERPSFTFDPLFHAGCYYVQEASSMFIEQAIRRYVDNPVVMLDLCAAPGGKSTLLRSLLPEGSLLVANEVMRNRSQILAENIIKWGHPEVIVTNNDPADFTKLTNMFDVILTDVPCSGEGMFRKDEVAISEWSTNNVEICYTRQRRILEDIWPTLKPGGILIYSTCTYNREENEDNVKWISEELGAQILPVNANEEWNITGNLTENIFPAYRFMPHKTTGEGFFMAVLRKDDDEKTNESNIDAFGFSKVKSKKKGKDNGKSNFQTVPDGVKEWLKDSTKYSFENFNDSITAFPLEHIDNYQRVKSVLKIIHAGVEVGNIKGRDIIPAHSLAMSKYIERSMFTTADLDYRDAISYLRKEAIAIGPEYPRGYILFTYRNIPLGFAKNIGNRTNNLYPQEWRIRSGYLPENEVSVI